MSRSLIHIVELLQPPPKSTAETPVVIVTEADSEETYKMSEDEERELAELMGDD